MPTYPSTPRIKFENIEKYRKTESFTGAKIDSIVISIHFEDGNGDLGNLKDDTTQNYFIDFMRKKNDVYTELDFLDLGKTFPRLAPNDEYIGPLEGSLSLNTKILHQTDINSGIGTPNPNLLDYGDTVRFDIRIRDRSGNMSNKISTDELIITP